MGQLTNSTNAGFEFTQILLRRILGSILRLIMYLLKHKNYHIKAIAVLATVSVFVLILSLRFALLNRFLGISFGVAAVAIAVLLFDINILISKIKSAPWPQIKRHLLFHSLLHLVPATYVVVQFNSKPSMLVNFIFLIPMMAFFYTGSKVWEDLFQALGSKIYRMFQFGNVALMRTCPIFLALGFFIKESIGTEGFQQIVVFYFSVHSLITGAVIIKIKIKKSISSL